MHSIEVIDLKKSYGKIDAVNGISFSIEQGEIFGMLGPNGAGKTTTIEIIEGLRKPDSGKVSVLGMDVTLQTQKVKAHIGVQLQNTALFPRLTVYEVLKLFATFFDGETRSPEKLIEMVDLGEKRNTLSKNLSGGQRQRLSVALALVNNPEIVFLDEPTTGLDPQARRNMWKIIRQIQELDTTVLLTTHYMEEAQALCSRVAVVDRGKVIAMDSPATLIRKNFEESVVEVEVNPNQPVDGIFHNVQGLTRPEVIEDHHVTLYTRNSVATMGHLMELVQKEKVHFESLNVRMASLEDVFLKLTGKNIRE